MRTTVTDLITPDQANLSDEAMKYLRRLAGIFEDSYAVNEALGNERYAYNPKLNHHLQTHTYVSRTRFPEGVVEEYLRVGYVSIPEDKKYANAGLFYNHYSGVHPYAIITGSENATHEVIITNSGFGDTTIGYIRCTDVDFSTDNRGGTTISRMRLHTDGVDEEHGRAFIAEIEASGNISSVFGANGGFRIEGIIASISGYPLGHTPKREKHNCSRNDENCYATYDMKYSPSHESHNIRSIPHNIKNLGLLDVFRGASVYITIRPIKNKEE